MDDVGFLRRRAREDSYLFLVDSQARDASVWPSPSQYEVVFRQPFRNVVGLDLLDATVARTEYLVESNTNVLEYALGQPASLDEWAGGAWATSRKRTVALDPGDYTLPSFVEHLDAKLAEAAAAAGEAPVRASVDTVSADESSRVVLACSEPFTLLAGPATTLRYTLGFGDPVTSTASADYAAVPGWSVNRTGGASNAFLSRGSALPDPEPLTATLGPVPAGQGVQVEEAADELRQYFVALATGTPTSLAVYCYGTTATLAVAVVAASSGVTVATGTVGVNVTQEEAALEPVRCPLSGTGVMTEGSTYYVELSGAGVSVHYNEDNLPVAGDRYVTKGGSTVHDGQNLCLDVSLAAWGYAVRSPGLVNLTGPRYVNIRCPEIESHMFRDRVNETGHTGLGMVALRGYGFRRERFDFVTFPPRRFHPIGKLTKLTFRLERPDGSLYDSHGVDHTLLLVLRYMTMPDGKGTDETQTTSELNPSYDPDLNAWLVRHRWADQARASHAAQDKLY